MDPLTITLTVEEIFKEVDIRTYYYGEKLKQGDTSAALLQTSSDDYDAMFTYLDTALNDVCGYALKKVRAFDFSVDHEGESITLSFLPYFRIPKQHAVIVLRLLRKSISDYLVNRCIEEWLTTVQPELAVTYTAKNSQLLDAVLKHIGMISGQRQVRRRATNLAGI